AAERRERTEHQVPLRRLRQLRRRTRRALLEGLEESRAPPSVIHAPAAPADRVQEAGAVEAPTPADVPARRVALRPLRLEERLGATVPDLLAPVGPQRRPSAVPDDRGRA